MIADANGNLFGTTVSSDVHTGLPEDGFGTVFQITGGGFAAVPADATPPVMTPNLSGILGSNGWYIGNVTINWTVADNESTITSQSGCGSTTATGDTSGTVFTCQATSAGGANSQSVTIKRDATPPSVSCGSPDGLWHASDVSIACTAFDSTSGLANPANAAFNLTTSVAGGAETANASTNSRSVSDVAGNAVNAGPIAGNKVDKKAPAVTITTPTATSYLLNQAVAASYSCSDGGSGVASCVGTAANGANINTATAGSKTFAVNAADNAGNTGNASVGYTVNYNFSGFLPPVNSAPTVNTGKAGRSYPVKWQLRDGSGNYLSALSAIASITYQSTGCGSFGNVPTDPLEASTTGSSGLRYDSTASQYIYNWATPASAGCYSLYVTLNSGQVFVAYFNLN